MFIKHGDNIMNEQLPLPEFFDENKTDRVWRVDYRMLSEKAPEWSERYNIEPASEDESKTALLLIDNQNTFCLPDFELFAAGRSGRGAVDDSKRLCKFIYGNLHRITKIYASMDTHRAVQIFHPVFLVDNDGHHPAPFTPISFDDIDSGKWKINPAIRDQLPFKSETELERYLKHYVEQLSENSKYDYMIWPYHAMLGGIGHALVSSIEEALFFHNMVRQSQTHFELKGSRTMTENYSIISPEVLTDHRGKEIASKNRIFIDIILNYDRVIIAGQAKSHCIAWTIDDILREIQNRGPGLAGKIYLLEDCTSPVVIEGGADFTDAADEAFARFADAGMHRVKSTDDIDNWPGFGG